MADIEKGLNPADFVFRAPTQNVDGSPIDGTLTYTIYRLSDENDPASAQPYLVLPPSLNQRQDGAYVVQLPDFVAGRHVIALTASDLDGDESALSNTLGFTQTAVGVAPSPPAFLDA